MAMHITATYKKTSQDDECSVLNIYTNSLETLDGCSGNVQESEKSYHFIINNGYVVWLDQQYPPQKISYDIIDHGEFISILNNNDESWDYEINSID